MSSLKSSQNSLVCINKSATTTIYTLSLHDALPISLKTIGLLIARAEASAPKVVVALRYHVPVPSALLYLNATDRKSTRLNSSHRCISYAVFCLKKKNTKTTSSKNFVDIGTRLYITR